MEKERWSLASQQWGGEVSPDGKANLPDLHLMIDFETFSTDTSNGGIMAAAVVPFFLCGDMPKGDDAIEAFCQYATMESNYFSGRDMSGSQMWWCHYDRSMSRESYLKKIKNGEAVHVDELERNLVDYLGRLVKRYGCGYKEVYLWSRGAFDVDILKAVFARHEAAFPIPFYRVRDARTFIAAHYVPERQFRLIGETLHCPDVDCANDIRAIRFIYQSLDACGFFERVEAVTPEWNHDDLRMYQMYGKVIAYENL